MAAAEAQREEEANWAAQEEAILRMRGMLEDENVCSSSTEESGQSHRLILRI